MTKINVTVIDDFVTSFDMRTPAQIEADEQWLNEQFGAYTDEQ